MKPGAGLRTGGVFILSLVVWLTAILCDAGAADYLTGSGCSVSNVGYLTELAKDYEKKTGIKIFVRGGGSVVGIEDLRSGKVDFAAACRAKEAGDPEDVQFIQVAWDVLVFIVHKTNPVDNITLDTVRAIYSGKVTNWRQLKGSDAPIKTYVSRPKKGLSGVEASTRKMVLNGKDPVPSPHIYSVASTGIVEQMVEDTPEGFATTGYTSARKRDVKMLKVKGASPTYINIVGNRYPLKRPLFILIPKSPRPEVKRFVDYVLGKEGQQFIRSQGVVPLRDLK
jgi:phosphate transport system substrate-binding protein